MNRILPTLAVCLAVFLPGSLTGQSRHSEQGSKSSFDWKHFGDQMKQAVSKGDLTEKQASEANRLMKFYVALDANGNQVIEPAEYAKSRYRSTIEKRIRDAGFSPSSPVALSSFIVKRLGNAGVPATRVERVFNAYKPKAHRQISLDLPESYHELDTDQDNQIGLYEWPKSRIEDFFKLDLNNDGFATPREITIVENAPFEEAGDE